MARAAAKRGRSRRAVEETEAPGWLGRVTAEAAGVSMGVEAEDLVVRADAEMLLQILLNLMLNALEASPGGSVISLRLAAHGAHARLAVEDHGRGIEPELQERLFKPYVTGRDAGHGLGLAIVDRMVALHGWAIAVHSQPSRGTVFQIDGIEIASKREGRA